MISTSNTEERSDKSNIDNPAPQIPTVITTEGEYDKGVLIERQETDNSFHSNGSTADQQSIISSSYNSQAGLLMYTDTKNSSRTDPLQIIGDHNITESTNIKLSNSTNFKKGGDTVSSASLTPSFILKSKPAPPRRTNTLGNIGIELINDEGETECVDIDIADIENTIDEDKYLHNTRRQSISDRINRRRTSELAAEIIRLSAEHRKKEFADLLDEHEEIVQNIEIWKATGVLPPLKCHKKSALETVDDEDSDDIIDEEPAYFRQINDNASFYLSSNRFNQDNKENKTLPRSH